MKSISTKQANVLLLITSIIWGAGFVATTIALKEGITPLQLMCSRFFLGTIILNIIFYRKIKNITLKEIKSGVLIGICLFFGFIFQTYGLMYCSASVSAFVTVTYVIMVPFLSLFFYKVKIDKKSVISCIITVIGVSLISVRGDMRFSIGAILTLIGALFFATQIVITEKYTKEYDPITITVVMTTFAFLISFICVFVIAILHNNLPVLNTKGISAILYLGILSTVFAYLCLNIAQKYASAVSVGIICSFESIFAAFFSFIIFKEVFDSKMIVGCILLFIAIIISEYRKESNVVYKKTSF